MGKRSISKVLIANRGEIAVRIIRACRDLGIRTVAVYSEADRSFPHVRLADEAYCIGSAPASESYLLKDRIIDVAKRARADAIHPGYGFLAENSEFAQMVGDSGLIFIGPTAGAMRQMGDKVSARALAKSVDVPIVPGTEVLESDSIAVRKILAHLKLPLLVKASGGGGGKGMRLVKSAAELEPAIRVARSEAEKAFGDSRIYIEKYLEAPRHIEIQILADHDGAVVHLGERECSIQRRHQKIIEESPSVAVNEELREQLGDAAVRVARKAGYTNAGTVEFLVDREKNFYFLEVNTRVQVEHPVTELVTGIDIVKAQLRIAAGEAINYRPEELRIKRHAIECRIYAEDPMNGFLPSVGMLKYLRTPSHPNVREDRGIDEGNEISVYYDPMISKLISSGETRHEAIGHMREFLSRYNVVGVTTNIELCRWILEHPKFLEGDLDTHFLDTFFDPSQSLQAPQEYEKIAAIFASLLQEGPFSIVSEVRTNHRRSIQRSLWRGRRTEYFR